MDRPKVVRLGNTFTLDEAFHMVRILEAAVACDGRAASRMAMDPLGALVLRKFRAMREAGRKRMAGEPVKRGPLSTKASAIRDRARHAKKRADTALRRAMEARMAEEALASGARPGLLSAE